MKAKRPLLALLGILAFLLPLGSLYLYQNKLQTEVAKPPAPLGMATRASVFLGSNTGKGVVCAGVGLVAAGIWWKFFRKGSSGPGFFSRLWGSRNRQAPKAALPEYSFPPQIEVVKDSTKRVSYPNSGKARGVS